MLTRRVLPLVAQLRFEHAAIVATLCANISLAGMYFEVRNIEHGYMLAYSERNRPPIPRQIGHLFRSNPATVPEQIGHPVGGLK